MNFQQPLASLPSALHRAFSSSVAFFLKYAATAFTGSVGSMSVASLMKHCTASPTQSRFSVPGRFAAFSFSENPSASCGTPSLSNFTSSLIVNPSSLA